MSTGYNLIANFKEFNRIDANSNWTSCIIAWPGVENLTENLFEPCLAGCSYYVSSLNPRIQGVKERRKRDWKTWMN